MNPAQKSNMESYLWNADTVMAATGGQGAGDWHDWHAVGVSIDSRSVRPGDLFVAIKGPKFDGHDFACAALKAGASAVVIDHLPNGPGALAPEAPVLEVNNTTQALEKLGIAARTKAQARIIAVTGSVGKTGTKEALRFVLEGQGPTTATQGSLNNHWGVPLSLARLPSDDFYGVFEIGMNHAGEITPLSKMVRPHVCIITNVEDVHSAHFNSTEDIADAKAEIFSGMEPGGIAILNRDNAQYDRLCRAAEKAGVGTIIGFGAHAEAQARVLEVTPDCEGSAIKAVLGGAEHEYRIGVPGAHWVMNSLAVLAAIDAVGADIGMAAKELANMVGLKGRGQRHTVEGLGGTFVIIDESYNASPVSVKAALEVLGGMNPGGGGRRVAVLGDMLELGEQTEKHHAALVATLIEQKINLVFTAGQYMGALWDVLPKSMRGGSSATSAGLLPKVKAMIRAGDVIVVKGSAGSNMSPIIEGLLDLGNPCGADPDTHKHVANG